MKSTKERTGNDKQNNPKQKGQLNLLGLTMLGLGGAIGSGIFVASGVAVNQAGPSIVLSFIVGGVISTLIMRILAEMSVYEPTTGSFSVYAGEFLGPGMGFISGWLYWITGILTLATEMVAAALIVEFWLPAWPVWLISLIIAVLIIGISLLNVKSFARVEEVLSFLKIGILVVVILMGIVLFSGFWPGLKSPGFSNYLGHGGIFPHGLTGFLSSLLLVLYTYAGEQVIGPATGETEDTARTVPRAVFLINVTLVVLYLGAMSALTGIIPWNSVPQNASGFVLVFEKLGLYSLTSIVNAVILTAILSAMNSNMYGVPRMLKSLATRHNAPAFLMKEDARGVPVAAVLASAAFLLIVVGISYILPHNIFVYIASASGVSILLNWVIIAITHFRFRQKAKTKQLAVKQYSFPYATVAAIILLLVALSTSVLSRNQLVGFFIGIIILLLFVALYFFLVKGRHNRNKI